VSFFVRKQKIIIQRPAWFWIKLSQWMPKEKDGFQLNVEVVKKVCEKTIVMKMALDMFFRILALGVGVLLVFDFIVLSMFMMCTLLVDLWSGFIFV